MAIALQGQNADGDGLDAVVAKLTPLSQHIGAQYHA